VARIQLWSVLTLELVVLGGTACTKSETPTLTAQAPLVLDTAGETLRLDEARVPVVASCADGQLVQKTGSGWTCATPGPGGVPVTWDTVTGKPNSFPPATHSHSWNEVTDKPVSFPPAEHSHGFSELTGVSASTEWPGTQTWSRVTGAPDFALTTSVTAVAGRVAAAESGLSTAQGKLTTMEGRVAALEGSSGTSSPMVMSAIPDDSALISAGYSMVGVGRPESFIARTSLPSVHSYVINAAVLGTKIYVAGGYIAPNQSTPNLREYDLVTDRWTARQQMSTARYGHVLVGARGKVYVFGGHTNTSPTLTTEIYDPQLNTWTTGAPLPDHNHYAAAHGILSDGKLHIVGGIDHISNKHSSTHIVYDFNTSTWSTARDLPTARSWSASGVLPDGRLIVAGGHDGSSYRAETYIFDPTTNSWTQVTSMPVGIHAHSGAVIAGKLHTFLGYTSSTYVNSHYVYDPISNIWSSGTAVPYSTHTSTVAQLRGGALIVGGWNNGAQTTVYEYLAPLHLYAK
jgi:N-acetylneuraminic acid mutarotase